MRRLLIVLVLIAGAAFAVHSIFAAGESLEGKAPPALELSSVINADRTPTLASLKGKVVVVEFWATWCGFCVKAIPHMNELNEKFADKGVVVIGITTEAEKKVKPFVAKHEMKYVVGIDDDGKTTKAYGIRGIPAAYVLDKEGVVRWEGHPADLTADVIEKLLK